MLKIKLICVGKLHYKELYETSKRFENMLSRFVKLEIIEIQESQKPFPKNLEEEKQNIIRYIKDEYVILTDKNGKEMSSEEFAMLIKNLLDTGKNITFIIGGHQGVSEKIYEKVNTTISFSKMTFGHNIFRIMLLEQIYRSFSIIFGTEYHK